jgi:hypothetical protein
VLRPPGQWQTYDIVFRRPLFKDGQEIDPGYITVFVNGVLTQDHTALEGKGGHKARSKAVPFPETGPLKLQDHGNPVRYRNIWLRPLPKRANDGGDTSHMTEEATKAKRAEIAKGIREDAAKLEGSAKMLRLLESLCYSEDTEARQASLSMVNAFAATVKALPAEKLDSQKGEILKVTSALRYMAKFNFVPNDLSTKLELEAMVRGNGWEKKK